MVIEQMQIDVSLAATTVVNFTLLHCHQISTYKGDLRQFFFYFWKNLFAVYQEGPILESPFEFFKAILVSIYQLKTEEEFKNLWKREDFTKIKNLFLDIFLEFNQLPSCKIDVVVDTISDILEMDINLAPDRSIFVYLEKLLFNSLEYLDPKIFNYIIVKSKVLLDLTLANHLFVLDVEKFSRGVLYTDYIGEVIKNMLITIGKETVQVGSFDFIFKGKELIPLNSKEKIKVINELLILTIKSKNVYAIRQGLAMLTNTFTQADWIDSNGTIKNLIRDYLMQIVPFLFEPIEYVYYLKIDGQQKEFTEDIPLYEYIKELILFKNNCNAESTLLTKKYNFNLFMFNKYIEILSREGIHQIENNSTIPIDSKFSIISTFLNLISNAFQMLNFYKNEEFLDEFTKVDSLVNAHVDFFFNQGNIYLIKKISQSYLNFFISLDTHLKECVNLDFLENSSSLSPAADMTNVVFFVEFDSFVNKILDFNRIELHEEIRNFIGFAVKIGLYTSHFINIRNDLFKTIINKYKLINQKKECLKND